MAKRLLNTTTSNDEDNNNQQRNRSIAKTASTSDQEFLTFLSTMDLPDEGVFASNNFTPSMIKNYSQFQSKNQNKKVVESTTTAGNNSIPQVNPSEPSNVALSVPFTNGNKVPMKVDGNMYIQSFLSSGVQNYQQAVPQIPAVAAANPEYNKHEEILRKKKIRNMRDQQRSQSINNQIKELRDLLQENGKKFEKTDKFSTLDTVMQFLKETQNRISSLETEYERYTKNNDKKSNVLSHPEVNYSAIFHKNPIAQATLSLDGKFIDVNEEFEVLTGFARYELFISSDASDNSEDDSSLFHILDTPETVKRVCKAMSQLIECSDANAEKEMNGEKNSDSDNHKVDTDHRFWQGDICSKKNPDMTLQMNITLAKSDEMDPPYLFQCTFSRK